MWNLKLLSLREEAATKGAEKFLPHILCVCIMRQSRKSKNLFQVLIQFVSFSSCLRKDSLTILIWIRIISLWRHQLNSLDSLRYNVHEIYGYYCDRLCMHKIASLSSQFSELLLFIPHSKIYQNTISWIYFYGRAFWENLFIMEIYELKIFITHSSIIHETIIIDAEISINVLRFIYRRSLGKYSMCEHKHSWRQFNCAIKAYWKFYSYM